MKQDRSWTEPLSTWVSNSSIATCDQRGPLGFYRPMNFFWGGKFSLTGLHHISKNRKRTNIKSTPKKTRKKNTCWSNQIWDLHGFPPWVPWGFFCWGRLDRSPDGSVTGRFFHFSAWLWLKDLLSGFSLFLTVTNGFSWAVVEKYVCVCVCGYIYIYIYIYTYLEHLRGAKWMVKGAWHLLGGAGIYIINIHIWYYVFIFVWINIYTWNPGSQAKIL